MKKGKFYLGLCLFFLGLMGILSMLTVDIPLPEEMQSILEEQFTPSQIQWLILINPTVIMLIGVIVGTLLYQKVNLSVPILEKMVGLKEDSPQTREILIYGTIGGLLTGIVLGLLGLIGRGLIPSEFEQLNESIQLTLTARFLYGGITEEILMRFGLMTLLVWIAAKISNGAKPSVYWIGIILASFIFAVGHFPIVFQSIDNPSSIMLAYVLIGNSFGGLVFGWLYWKKGLESAFLAHIFAHVWMVILKKFFLMSIQCHVACLSQLGARHWYFSGPLLDLGDFVFAYWNCCFCITKKTMKICFFISNSACFFLLPTLSRISLPE